jgi:hypothetical protein
MEICISFEKSAEESLKIKTKHGTKCRVPIKKKRNDIMEKTMYGFHFFLNGKDYFVETSHTRKTQNLARKILPMIGASDTEGNAKCLQNRMQKAKCEIKKSMCADRYYYEISGDGFGGYGSWTDDGETIILKMEE